MRRTLACLLLILALPVSAQIYKYTDANGNTVFTNQPPEGTKAESVELKPINTSTPAAAPATDSSEPRLSELPQNPYQILELRDLPNEEALRANNGTFSVGVTIEPRLGPGHTLRLLLDGKPYGQPSNVPRLQVTEVDRGEHSIAVAVMQGERIVQQSETRTFTVQRVSTNSPGRGN
ncbi:uncharacterized protein DUF4124 [Pseudomonas sp. URMO17WK12:I1]|uniref:DUF4124 domain-containing protein n=1 Tax=unclassified Pseudomonas TaxID=196821 RepID=UPI000488FB92|nr:MULTISPECIES: DUF4124 domain-containing protein [unclassified Pseudomonas]PZW67254.1 uncharacterized protein DUF4124 [Pseudomonas sp. URMO17WK12:I1]